jgi:hypothetical protein
MRCQVLWKRNSRPEGSDFGKKIKIRYLTNTAKRKTNKGIKRKAELYRELGRQVGVRNLVYLHYIRCAPWAPSSYRLNYERIRKN